MMIETRGLCTSFGDHVVLLMADLHHLGRSKGRGLHNEFKLPGYLAGVYHDGDQTVVAHGVVNVVTGVPMTEDTGFLFGSVTKVLTTTLVLQQVERGIIDLD